VINHVRQSLNALRTTFNHYSDAYSTKSYNSTFSDIRSEYGQLSPRLEVTPHVIREDYSKLLPPQMQDYCQVLLDEWIRSGRKVDTRPYKRAPAQKIRLLEDEEASITGTWDRNWQRAPTDVLEERSQVSVFGSVSFRDQGRLKPPPASISMALNRNHPISHLPGMNSNYGGTD
jgi:hypothetical protein